MRRSLKKLPALAFAGCFLLASAGCETFRHKQAILPVTVAQASASDHVGLCAVLEGVAQEHGLTAQPPGNDNVLCYFKKELNGFPLILGARVDAATTLVDVWSWNISQDFEALEDAVVVRLKENYGEAVSFPEKPVPL